LRLGNTLGLALSAGFAVEFFLDDLVAQLDTFIADLDARPREQLAHLLLGFAAKRNFRRSGSSPNLNMGQAPLKV
jgi:hypothetical protein